MLPGCNFKFIENHSVLAQQGSGTGFGGSIKSKNIHASIIGDLLKPVIPAQVGTLQ